MKLPTPPPETLQADLAVRELDLAIDKLVERKTRRQRWVGLRQLTHELRKHADGLEALAALARKMDAYVHRVVRLRHPKMDRDLTLLRRRRWYRVRELARRAAQDAAGAAMKKPHNDDLRSSAGSAASQPKETTNEK